MVEVQAESVEYLQSLQSIRERCERVMELAKKDQVECFTLDLDKLPKVADYVVTLIERDYGPFCKETLQKIPPHGRWLHFGPGRVEELIKTVGQNDALPAVLDLFVVAVLLDAGAGDKWKYKVESTGETLNRSEGLAVATFYMFTKGLFSSNPSNPLQVDAEGLAKLTLNDLAAGMQVSETNPLVGLEGRFTLLKKLGQLLNDRQSPYFQGEIGRPSNFINFLKLKQSSDGTVSIDVLWEVVIKGFGAVWPPAGAKIDGVPLGDAWEMKLDTATNFIVPFHKLSQWLTYSLLLPVTKLSNLKVTGTEKMTGLPEYRNGGLFLDLGVISLKSDALLTGLSRPEAYKVDQIPAFNVHEQTIVEWRALTVCLLDFVAEELRNRIGATKEELTLPMVLEAGTWKAGREISAKLRPTTKNPPISIISDGTVF